jgi:hypothetical protein
MKFKLRVNLKLTTQRKKKYKRCVRITSSFSAPKIEHRHVFIFLKVNFLIYKIIRKYPYENKMIISYKIF